ncbi:hypothetical protein HYW73_03570 [Candidatus Nomurabacteria bacterium]|nr:hypothetical protein [Candidatus Nomurabacteria bacterium]
MAVALLAQPFFNVSTIIEVKQKNRLSLVLEKINPNFPFFPGREKRIHLSKEMDLSKTEKKTQNELLIDYLIFRAVFDKGHPDRSFELRHNIRLGNDTYALFDFENCCLTPIKYFESERKVRQRPTFLGFHQNPRVDLVSGIVKKLADMKNFFDGKEGEDFVRSVLEKTRYAEGYKEECKQWHNPIDDSYTDARELTQGLLAQITFCASILLEELKQEMDKWVKFDKHGKEAAENFLHFDPTLISELEKLSSRL